jgi:EAL domain-containing protein (putative c-di-GMP-specific phosphodiesterase class I)
LRGATLFVNAHPAETALPDFVSRHRPAGARASGIELVIEIHETAVGRDLAHATSSAIASPTSACASPYDDFGAGQARSNELSEAPAAFRPSSNGAGQRLGHGQARASSG